MALTSSEISRLLDAWSAGETKALDQLTPLVYQELRQMARRFFEVERTNHTLQPTALANEVFIKLKGQRKVRWRSRAEFFAVAATNMRRILVNHARERRALKRGGGKAITVILDEELLPPEETDLELVALDDALQALAETDEVRSRVVELRIFGGLTRKEVAEVLGVSLSTVNRLWKGALMWLRRELDKPLEEGSG